MLREIEVTLIPGSGHDSAVMPDGVNEVDRRWYHPRQLTFLPRERSTRGRRW